ncbi:FliI/YscN family ATPase [Aquipuribacter nitratireducens]|uniref:Flagellum-specific ATP synthase n=1 Tax=Aquipuribacter nitratireducens TaxID=650104 RepID=A0ABW0GNF2_9MICO
MSRALAAATASALAPRLERAGDAAAPRRSGRVCGVVGLGVEVDGVQAAVGEILELDAPTGPLEAEVVAAHGPRLSCTPLHGTTGLSVGTPVRATGTTARVPLGPGLLGRVIDPTGRPLDGRPAPVAAAWGAVEASAPSPLARGRIDARLPLGVRVLDAFTPVGRGQRIGVFAGSGVGKSSLLSMITRNNAATVTVVALVGERGREVRQFVEDDLGPEGLARSVVVVATSDDPPLLRLRAAFAATRIAEGFAAAGHDVVLLMDSLTRVAHAQREVALSAGEPPATRGFPPSVFAVLPRLLERAGPLPVGSITGVYTVLVDGDDHNEPVADNVRAVLDGHVVLDRAIATAGRFPSVDVLASISRLDRHVSAPDDLAAAARVRRLLAAHRDARDLVEVGAYVPGSNADVDAALRLQRPIEDFCRQGLAEPAPLARTLDGLRALAHAAGGAS